jgi:hypothetical protein
MNSTAGPSPAADARIAASTARMPSSAGGLGMGNVS